MSWRYAIGRDPNRGYHVIELYGDVSWTGEISPYGETKAELIADLETMLADIRESDCPEKAI